MTVNNIGEGKERLRHPRSILVLTIVCCGLSLNPLLASAGSEKKTQVASGPLQVLPSNPHYFTDGTGKAIYLTGSHVWNNLLDWSDQPTLDYTGFLDILQSHNHNFIRLWTWEHASVPQQQEHRPYILVWTHLPLPYQRTGAGNDLSGLPKFDLTRLNQPYFDRLRLRVQAAQDRNIYVSVMLFNGWSLEGKGNPWNPWPGHPFNINNNVNGINGDLDGDGEGTEVHTLQVSAITALQETYVEKVIDTLNDLDNVLYEISNESHGNSERWQYHMIDFIKKYEAEQSKQHPVGMTVEYLGSDNSELTNSPADWISPSRWPVKGTPLAQHYDYRKSPPAADGKKVIILDTDHLWGLGGNPDWVWKSFFRGLNPIFMDLDPHQREQRGGQINLSNWEAIRRAMGYTRTWAERVDLASMKPRIEIASSEYCLAAEGEAYLVYLPVDHQKELVNKTVSVDLSATSAPLAVEWFNPKTTETILAGTTEGGTIKTFKAPFPGNAVLYVHSHQ